MSAERFRRVADDFFVAPQLTEQDFAAAAALGIRTIINNRPDGEAADQLDSEQARRLAEDAGIAYAHVPVVTGGIGPDAVASFADAVAVHAGPYLAYCRSGTRSCFLWGLAAARTLPAATILKSAAEAGYDLSPALPALRRANGEG